MSIQWASKDPHLPLTATKPSWTLPVQLDPFLDWLDGTVGLGDTDEERVKAFMLLEVAKFMPVTLRDDLRREGLL